MLKPTRTILALAAGSLVLGLVGAGIAVADEDPMADNPGQENILDDQEEADELDEYPEREHARGVVISRGPLTVRSRPTTHSHKVGKVHPHQKLAIECKKRAERVDGNNLWYRLDGVRDDMRDDEDGEDGEDGGRTGAKSAKDRHHRWVSARYVKNITPVKYCRS
ncbi:hypothetical protein J7F03_16715 [Streptomyces sp. ISL-43]|uniref:hypothetical protein n=1 Tax=Streptomyces sp. ISL-43 TaxID=2819183 RepID=UPI001BEA3945|nr:hypothetical protein [Streptomyces sp. ISL-43]MBT2448704.1 hypothetical protein [Streptomyces sp. ISL-43]